MTLQDAVLALLESDAGRAMSTVELQSKLQSTWPTIGAAIHNLVARGRIERLKFGYYRLVIMDAPK